MRTLLLDGDMIAWRIAFHPERVAQRAVNWIEKQLAELCADRVVVAFSDITGRYFRHDLCPNYKPRRSEQPPALAEAMDAMGTAFPMRRISGLEADDVLGILATCPTMKGTRVIVSGDKDLRSIPGFHYNPFCEPRTGITEITEQQADFNHLWQTLTGDGGDGYPGCPRIGPVKARKILWGERHQWWPQVRFAFRNAGLSEADAVLQARLARILRADDYDFATRQPRLWNPPAPVAIGGTA